VTSVWISGFLPSTSGLHFLNQFPSEPAGEFPLPDGRILSLGNAANGLCGGMAFSARDYYEAGRQPPSDMAPPAEGTPLFEYLVGRLLASFNLPLGVLRYIELMNPLLPDTDTTESRLFPISSRSQVMLSHEWPLVKQELDAGHPAALGLIKVKSSDVNNVGQNHQVLAYGYDLDESQLVLHIYDPNYPDNDAVQLSLDPAYGAPVTYSPPEMVYCFFHTPYSPPAVAPP
jgi:hypothetical protein